MGGIPHYSQCYLELSHLDSHHCCCQVDVPTTQILVGSKGSSSSGDIMKLARESISQDLLGIMVWYCSLQDGLQYETSWDCSGSEESSRAYVEAMKYLNENSS